MLKKRIIGVLLLQDGIVVQSIGFRRYLPVGKPEIAAAFLNNWGVDEIMLLDISATPRGRGIAPKLVSAVSRCSFVPLTVGGGITSIETATELLHHGADKVAINSAALRNPDLIEQIASHFGEQCVVLGVDSRRNKDGTYEVFSGSGREASTKRPDEWAAEAVSRGAGEILVQSIDRDGSQQGYDHELLELVSKKVQVPLIALGGLGHPRHIHELAAKVDISGFGAGNFFHFTEHSVTILKAYLDDSLPIRKEGYADYNDATFLENGRLAKKADRILQDLRFVHYEKEVI